MIGGLQPFIGRLIDRVGARLVITVGLALVAIAALALSRAEQMWQVWFAYGVIGGVAFGATLQLTGGLLAASWFVGRRGLAVGVVQSGVAAASFAILSLATWSPSA